jgi:hypothetical protein
LDIENYQRAYELLGEMWKLGDKAVNTQAYKDLVAEIDILEKKLVNIINTDKLNKNLQETFDKFGELAENIDKTYDETTKIEMVGKAVEDLGIAINSENANYIATLIKNIVAGGEEGYAKLQELITLSAISLGVSAEDLSELWANGWSKGIDAASEELQTFFALLENTGLGAWGEGESFNLTFTPVAKPQYDTNIKAPEVSTESWVSSYDWLYNLEQKTTSLIREKEKAERAYERALKDSSVSAASLKEAT